MKRWIALPISIGVLTSSCFWASFGNDSSAPGAVTVFLTGQEDGSLKPCGCSAGQLGGLERRAALLEQVPEEYRLVLSTGDLVETDSEQDLVKFPIFLQAYRLLAYDVVNFTEHDLQIAGQTGAMDQVQGSDIQLISGVSPEQEMPSVFSRTFMLRNREIRVKVISVPVEGALEAMVLTEAQEALPVVRFFLLNSEDQDRLDALSQYTTTWDCIITPARLEEPKVMRDPNADHSRGEGALVVSIGRRGRYLGRLDINWDAQIDRPRLHFSSLPVSEDLPNHPDLVRLYQNYQHIVSVSNLLERFPRVPLTEDDLSYTGSDSCRQCHGYEYHMWSQKKHAHAFAILEEVGSQRDPECVICHVVGMEYESGYISENETPLLKNVGCEVCHGPGSEHIRTYGQIKTTNPQKACLDCHTPEHSSGYAGHEEEFLEKIRHWMEP